MSKWRFNLRQSKDLSLIGELTDASGKSLTLGAQRLLALPTGITAMSAEWACYIQPINTCISAEMYDWRATKAMN